MSVVMQKEINKLKRELSTSKLQLRLLVNSAYRKYVDVEHINKRVREWSVLIVETQEKLAAYELLLEMEKNQKRCSYNREP